MSTGWLNVLYLVPVFLFSLCFHEFAHAWVAVKRGDPTPENDGRLTLHPFAHADWIGTILLPVVCIYYQVPFIGWAKPVEVDYRNLRGGRRDMSLVAAAGPISNIFLALLATGFLAILIRLPFEHQVLQTVGECTVLSIRINLMLAFFNLLPLPPLDGYMVLQGLFPARFAALLYRLSRFSIVILFLLLFSGGLRFLSVGVNTVFHGLLGWIGIGPM